MKILVVDDIGMSQIMSKRVLENAGYKVEIASSGTEAFKCILQNPDLDLVLCDLMMPDFSGVELIRKLKQVKQSNDLPVFILLTASQDAELIKEAASVGYADIMLKPMDPDRLIESIKSHCKDDK